MKLSHTVGGMGAINGQPRHLDVAVCDDGKLRKLVFRNALFQKLLLHHIVDLHDDFVHIRKNLLVKLHGPLLQRFLQNGVVGIGEGIHRNGHGLLEAYAFQSKKSHKLRHCHRWMGVIQLHCMELCKVLEVVMVLLMLSYEVLQGSRYKEVLLLQSQNLSFFHGVIGVKDLGDVLRIILFLYRFIIVLIVEGTEIK